MTSEQNFRKILAHAWTHSPLYRRIYTNCGIREQDLAHVSLEDLPVVSKADIMVNLDEAVTDPRLHLGELKLWLEQDMNPLNLYLDEYVVIHSSGGSSIRSYIPLTPMTWRLMTTTAAPALLPSASETRSAFRSAFFFVPMGHSASSTNTSLASHLAHQVLWLSITDPEEEICAKLNAFQPERLTSYASTLAWLAEWTLRGTLRIRPRSVVVSGDRLTSYIRSIVAAAWGADIYDIYAGVESPYMAVRRPGCDDYEVFTDLNVLEVVDTARRMVTPGQRGRVLLTNLINETLPLIRFDLGDEAVLGLAGYGAQTLKCIDGKADIRLTVRLTSGEVGALPIHELDRLNVPECGKIRFISHSPDEVEIQYEAPRDLDAQVETAFRTLLSSASATARSIRPRRVSRLRNDVVTGKFREVIPPDYQTKPLVRFYDHGDALRRRTLPLSGNALTTFSASDPPQSLFQRFTEIANRYPEHVAVTDGERRLTYRECSHAAWRIAQGLLHRGFDPARPVGVLSGHSIEMIPLLFGVLAAGGFYLPLDPHSPLERLQTILSETLPGELLTVHGQKNAVLRLAGPRKTVLRMEELLSGPSDAEGLPDSFAETPACLLYTSGSTGTPKGVIFSHKTVLHRIMRYTRDFHLGVNDRISLLQSFAVSAGIRDIFGSLLNGATLALYDIRSQGVQSLPGWLNRHGITVFYAVPTIFRLFLEVPSEDPLVSIRVVRLGGEAVQPRDLNGFKRRFPSGCSMVNGYASTETGTICQCVMDHDTDIVANRVPAGMPVEGLSVEILDETGHTVPDALGEIAVYGETLAKGYWDPHARKIVPLAHHLFPTGDLGYRLPDGPIFLTGRRDFIVKISGHRINLDDIENTLSAVSGISEAVAVSQATPAGDTAIGVYYVAEEGAVSPQERLRREAAAILPGPAIPISFISLPALPRLPGGKINRNVLSQHTAFQLQAPGEDAAYRNKTEEDLAGIWKDVLGIKVIPTGAEFIAMGGDSVSAFRILTRLRDLMQVEVTVQEFFNNPTIQGLARVIDAKQAASGRVSG
jgi:amino acid adenylation domain-containing protein